MLLAGVVPGLANQPDALQTLDRLLGAGRAEDVVSKARQLLESGQLEDRYTWQIRQRLGVALLSVGRPADAVLVLEEVIVEAPDDAASHLNLGRALVQLGKPGRAMAEMQQAVALAPDRALWQLEYGEVLAALGIHAEAHRAIVEARRLCGDCPPALLGEANLHLARGAYADAVEPLATLYHMERLPDVRRLLVHSLWNLGDAEGVGAVLDSLDTALLSGEELLVLVQADRARGLVRRSLDWGENGLGDLPLDARSAADFWAIVSQVCLDCGASETALSAIDRAVALRPEAAIYHQNRAAVLVALGRDDEARRAVARAEALARTTGR